MQLLRWIVGVTLFLALLFLSLQNAEQVTLKFYHFWSWQAPLVFVVLIAFALGVAAGLLAGTMRARAPQAPAEPPAPRAAQRSRRRGAGARPGGGALPDDQRSDRRRSSRAAAARMHPTSEPSDGIRPLVAAADPRGVLRAGLDRRAHRHQAPAARVAGAAAVVLPRPQFPAERAARQGDRVVHRGGQGRPADHRPALRAGQPVPAAGRDRPGDPHAPEPPRPAGPARGQAAGGELRAGAGLPPRRAARPRRGAVRQARRHAVRARSRWASCCRSTRPRRTGPRRSP